MLVLAGAVCASAGNVAGLTSTKSSSRTGSPLAVSIPSREHKNDSRGANKSQRLAVNMKAVATEITTNPSSDTSDESSARTVVSIILGGGVGSRLYPLTKGRSKPAVPVGGAYRLIDIPMSNCLNSGINKVYVLTQFNSRSLNRHILRTYNNGNGIGLYGGGGFVEVLAASQTPDIKNWFRGTADAVRQYVWLLEDVKNKDVEDVVILSGDHLYRMDYMDFVKKHRETEADITISCLPCDDERASDFGLMKIDSTGRVIDFFEKPKGEDLKKMKVDTTVLGLGQEEAESKPYIASMGIYVFKKDVLLKLLRWRFPDALDFGSEIIPSAASEYNIQAYLFNEYWEDIGTIKSFFDANLSLCDENPNFKFYEASTPIFTSPRNLPATEIRDSDISKSIISHGCLIEKSTIEHSIVGVRSIIGENVSFKDVLMVGADFYESNKERLNPGANGTVPIGVGANSVINTAILDKNCRIGKNVKITNKEGVTEANHEDDGWYVRSGIPIVLKNATIPDGFEF